MSIEDLIIRNTEAVSALTRAIRDLAGALGGRSAPVPVAPEASAPAPVAPEASAPVPVAPEASAPAPVAPEASAPVIQLADARAVCIRAGQAGLTDVVVGFLGEHGVKRLNDLDPARFPALLALLASKGVN